ncbi:MAG: sialidase family protein [Chloroflexota bacterium]
MIYRSSVLTPFFSLVFIAALILPSLASPLSTLAEEPDWSQPIAINDYGGVGVEREDPHMVVSGSGKLYVVWVDHRNSRSDIYFSYSADQGTSWSANAQVNDDASGGLYPQVAIDAAGKIYVAYADGSGVYLVTSIDNGNSWSAATQVASVTNPANLRLVADTRSGMEGHLNAMWLVWIYTSYTKVTARHIASTNGGQSWINSKLVIEGLYDGENVDIKGMDLARSDSSLRAALNNAPVNSDILSAGSSNNGKNWAVGNLTGSIFGAFSKPSITVDPNNLSFYAYHDHTGNLISMNSRPGTEGWQAATINSTTAEEIQGPAALAAYKDGRYYATWTQKMDGSSIRSLYFSESNDFGRNWSADVMLTEAKHHGKHSSLGVDDGGNLYAVWYDQEDYKAYHDIMFRRRGPSTGTPTPPAPVIVTIPTGGGTVTSNDPLELVTAYVPPTWDEVIVELRYKPALPVSAASVQAGALQSAGIWFDLSATDGLGDPLIDLVSPMTITVRYLNDGSIPTDTLKLYGWNGTEYVDEGITQIARTDYAVTSTVDHLTLFNLMGEGLDLYRVYLPIVIKSPGE